MQLVICGTEIMKAELLSNKIEDLSVNLIQTLEGYTGTSRADVIIDLLFENNSERIKKLSSIADLVVVNSVITTIQQTNPSFIRINGWPGFLKAPVIEASAAKVPHKEKASILFQKLGKQLHWLLDEPGFISPRIICMIINEAYFALAEGVSTKEEIDVAMKLGTAYPYGPFEWTQQIGLNKIAELLSCLSKTDSRYLPAPLLLKEADV